MYKTLTALYKNQLHPLLHSIGRSADIIKDRFTDSSKWETECTAGIKIFLGPAQFVL